MPAIQPRHFISAILDAIQQSGGTGAYVSESDRVHPRKFVVTHNGEMFSLWVYIWTLTHGGRRSLPNEYRIQMTTVSSPLPVNPDGYTVLMGYYPDLSMFAGFDLQRHKTFSVGSPSVQVDIHTIHEALTNGLAFSVKDNDEIAVGIRPDQFLDYVVNSEALHTYGTDTIALGLVTQAVSSAPIIEQEITALPVDRQKTIASVTKLSRDANFRRKVLAAYENRCAVTRYQLKLVDAAHILPVAVEGSSDQVCNGIALSPTMHRAFDNGLIYLDEELNIKINEDSVANLEAQSLLGGVESLRFLMNRRIHLPADIVQWPNITFVKNANRCRRIPGYL